MIKLTYEAVDGVRESKQFKLLRGARVYAQKMIGTSPEISLMGYAVSSDGVAKIHRVTGCNLSDLFSDNPEEPE